MIEPLKDSDRFQQSAVADKLNELIEAYNKLEEKYMTHSHLLRDTLMGSETTGPGV